ncbi:MAG: hypothetical protein Q9180_008848, partial [Flavoplaca navasiana]
MVLGNLKGLKSQTDGTKSEPGKTLDNAIDRAIKVATDIKEFQKTQKDINSEKADNSIVATWKNEIKAARATTLTLDATASSTGSTSVPNPFANVKIEVPKTDLSAQTAASNHAMQGVQMAQQAVDVAQENYDQSVAKQAKTAAAMKEVEKKLEKLKEAGALLFFTVLTTVIDNIIIVRAEEFNRSMAKAGRRGMANGFLKIDGLEKQTIYVATLQIKAYFSLLVDISSMYTSIDRSHIREGVDLCTQLSKSAASKATSRAIQDKLSTYTENAAKEVAKIVST